MISVDIASYSDMDISWYGGKQLLVYARKPVAPVAVIAKYKAGEITAL